jgi:maltose O-acetyltransferase
MRNPVRALRDDLGGMHIRLRFANIVLALLPPFTLTRLRTLIYRACGVKIGPHSLIFGHIEMSGQGPVWERLVVGANCFINTPFHADLNGTITIGDNVSIGHHVVFITTDHEIGPPERRCGAAVRKAIVIENGCWIGAGTIILPGVTVGAGSVVSAGAVVTQDVPPNRVVGGSPARPVKTLSDA